MQIPSVVISFFVPFVVAGCATSPIASQHVAATAIAPDRAGSKASGHLRADFGHVYRLDFVVASNSPATSTGGPGAGAFSLTLEEGHGGEIRSGSNVALTPAGSSRVDVGMKLKASYFTLAQSDDLFVNTSAELSSADDPGTIHKLSTEGGALVSPGKPALIASVEDLQGHTRYQLTVTATKLR